LVGSFKTYVSFAEKPYKRDLYSAKETHILKEPTHHSPVDRYSHAEKIKVPTSVSQQI